MSIKDKVINVASDIMSYPARRQAQKEMIASNKKIEEVRANISNKQALQKAALKPKEKIIYKPTYRIPTKPSNGIGVGY